MADIFKKHIIDSEGNYKIGYYPESTGNEFQKFVSEIQDLYVAWLAEPNTPEEIPYVPPVPHVPTLEELQEEVQGLIIAKQNEAYDGGFQFESNTYPSDRQYREIMATGARLGQKAIDTSGSLELSAMTVSGTFVVLDETQLVDIQQTYDDNGVLIYNTFMSEMAYFPTATSGELQHYILSGTFN